MLSGDILPPVPTFTGHRNTVKMGRPYLPLSTTFHNPPTLNTKSSQDTPTPTFVVPSANFKIQTRRPKYAVLYTIVMPICLYLIKCLKVRCLHCGYTRAKNVSIFYTCCRNFVANFGLDYSANRASSRMPTISQLPRGPGPHRIRAIHRSTHHDA